MRLLEEDTKEELGIKFKTYNLEKKLGQKEQIKFFAAISMCPGVEACDVNAHGDEIGADIGNFHSLRTDPKTWEQECLSRDLTVEGAVIYVAKNKCEVFFDCDGQLIVSTDIDDVYPYETIIENALKKF